MTEQDPKVELAAIKEQLVFIKEGVDEVKVSVTKLLEIDRSVAALEVKHSGQEKELEELTERVETLEQRQSSNTAYLNKLRGGISLMATILSLIQAAVVAAACWLLSSVISLHDEVSVMKTEVRYVQQEQDRQMRSLIQTQKQLIDGGAIK